MQIGDDGIVVLRKKRQIVVHDGKAKTSMDTIRDLLRTEGV